MTAPTDTAAERARALIGSLVINHGMGCVASMLEGAEREAAEALRAAEAGAIEKCARWHEDHASKWPPGVERDWHMASAIHFRDALASPSAMAMQREVVDEAEWRHFLEVMNSPAGPTPAMIAAAKLHRELTAGSQDSLPAAASPWREIEAAARAALDALNYAISFGYHYDRIVDARDALRAALPSPPASEGTTDA